MQEKYICVTTHQRTVAHNGVERVIQIPAKTKARMDRKYYLCPDASRKPEYDFGFCRRGRSRIATYNNNSI